MARINENYRKLQAGYLFPEIGRRVRAFSEANPSAKVIRLGIGDVTLPLAPAIVDAMRAACTEMGTAQGFRGYAPDPAYGYDFLLDAIREHDYRARGTDVSVDEIFVSDGSKQDSGNIQEIFGARCRIAVTDPVYPVYVDTNVMAGRTGPIGPDGRYAGILYLPGNEANGFTPGPPGERVDLVYLCSPNNPTGAVASRANLEAWVAWARASDAVIVFDAAYDAYVQDPTLPRSIYEIPGARECAIEMRSYSKRAGFTGVRCAYIVIPKTVTGKDDQGNRVPLHQLWSRRHSTKFNGASYPVQKGAAAVFSEQGKAEVKALIEHYMGNAKLLVEAAKAAGLQVFGGENAPYVWVGCPAGLGSWDMFDKMLNEAQVVITPGAGFGAAGEGWFRISAFNSRANVEEVCRRLKVLLG